MKKTIKYIVGPVLFHKMRKIYHNQMNLIKSTYNYYVDYKSYNKHSHVFKTDTFNKIESELILDYHSIEKGFLHENIRYRFAEDRVKRMLNNLEKIDYEVRKSSQVSIALKVLADYYEVHKLNEISIENYFPFEIYNVIKARITYKDDIVIKSNSEEYFENAQKSFPEFSNSRKSIRQFSQHLISIERIEQVLDLARNAPSVCNRQPCKVHFVQNKKIVDEILLLQGGLTGFSANVNQIMVLTCDRNYFFSVGERNQMYIDGGIFLMNLLYALHYNKIGACPANWGKEYQDDLSAQEILGLSPSEKIICVIAVGYVNGPIKYTLSMRRSVDEVLQIYD